MKDFGKFAGFMLFFTGLALLGQFVINSAAEAEVETSRLALAQREQFLREISDECIALMQAEEGYPSPALESWGPACELAEQIKVWVNSSEPIDYDRWLEVLYEIDKMDSGLLFGEIPHLETMWDHVAMVREFADLNFEVADMSAVAEIKVSEEGSPEILAVFSEKYRSDDAVEIKLDHRTKMVVAEYVSAQFGPIIINMFCPSLEQGTPAPSNLVTNCYVTSIWREIDQTPGGVPVYQIRGMFGDFVAGMVPY